jgi:V/A-type H+-transporting ATPase subunit A
VSDAAGQVVRVAGPVVVATGLDRARLYNLVRVGRRRLIGEVIRLQGDEALIQVYEETSGLQTGAAVEDTGAPLQVELGPGLLGQIFDGIQRPLPALAVKDGDPFGEPFIRRGVEIQAIPRDRTWKFTPNVALGHVVAPGSVLGTVPETARLLHRILMPPGVSGTVTKIHAGEVTVEDPIVWVDDRPLTMLQRWPVRYRRPAARRLEPTAPLITGQRVIDILYPLAIGGAATIPGGFGTGKTVQEQSLARWAAADVIVYIGCGERGNELTDVLEEFPKLTDPRSGDPLMQRTILIANTSNMPVAAREASIYTGMSIAEYYRDQGYSVLLLADSTSRWAEALREVSGRLEEMPGEEGFPAYLPSRLAEFYERAGAVRCLGADDREGSVTVVGAVSPPGADFSEPVTQYSLRLAGTFWALDTDLARRRHFPAIHWTRSYTLYDLGAWFDHNVAVDWEEQRRWALELLQQEEQLQSIVQLLGADVLAPTEQLVFLAGRMLREDLLQQSAFDDIDAFCPLVKQYLMLRVIRKAYEAVRRAVQDGADPEALTELPVFAEIGRMRVWPAEEAESRANDLETRIGDEVEAT